jgi:hypothetical protein
MTNRPAACGFGHYPIPVWFEEGGCKPLSDHAYAAILNYLEEDGNVEACREGTRTFDGKACKIPLSGETLFRGDAKFLSGFNPRRLVSTL